MKILLRCAGAGLLAALSPMIALAVPIQSSLGITPRIVYTDSSSTITAGPVEDPQTDSQSNTIDPLSVSSSVSLEEPSSIEGSAEAFGEATASWADADSGVFDFDVGWDIRCATGVLCDRAGVEISDGWQYEFIADTTGLFRLDYSWEAVAQVGSIFGIAEFMFEFTGAATEFFGDATSTASSGSGNGAFVRPVVAGQTYTARVSLLSDVGTNGSLEAGMAADFAWATSVPEPAPLVLMGLGLAGIGYRRRRSKKAA